MNKLQLKYMGVCFISSKAVSQGYLTAKLGSADSLMKARHWPADCPVCAAPARSARKTGVHRHTCMRCWWCTVTAKESVNNSEENNPSPDSAQPYHVNAAPVNKREGKPRLHIVPNLLLRSERQKEKRESRNRKYYKIVKNKIKRESFSKWSVFMGEKITSSL